MYIEFFPDTKVAKVSNIVLPEEAALLHSYAVEYKLSGRVSATDHLDDQDFGRTHEDSGEDDKDNTRDFWAKKNVYFEDMPYEYRVVQHAIKARALQAFDEYLAEVGDPRIKYDPYDVSPEAIHVYQPGDNLDAHEDCHDYALVIYLTNSAEYKGGQLHYLEPSNLLYKPEQGVMVIAPSNLVHEVLPITSGCRCSLTSFFPVHLP